MEGDHLLSVPVRNDTAGAEIRSVTWSVVLVRRRSRDGGECGQQLRRSRLREAAEPEVASTDEVDADLVACRRRGLFDVGDRALVDGEGCPLRMDPNKAHRGLPVLPR